MFGDSYVIDYNTVMKTLPREQKYASFANVKYVCLNPVLAVFCLIIALCRSSCILSLGVFFKDLNNVGHVADLIYCYSKFEAVKILL